MKRKRTTIRDVATEAQLSIATVSRVINNLGTVSEDNKNKVLEAIKRTNYYSNMTASNLKRNSSNIVGIVIPNVTNEYFMQIIKGLEDTFSKQKYVLYIASSNDNPVHEKNILKKFLENNVEAVILATTGENDSFIEELATTGLKIISIDRQVEKASNISFVGEANFQNAYKLTKKFLENVTQPIVIVNGLQNLSVGNDRLCGTISALEEVGEDYSILDGNYTEKGGEILFREIIDRFPNGCNIISLNNAMTTGIIKAIYERLPQDQRESYKIASYGKIQFQNLFQNFILCYVQQEPREIGIEAAKLVIRMNEKKYYENQTRLVMKTVIQGGS
ncbi:MULTISPECIES: LacI family DNA-binding transcriptional regulator [Enterococcus]|uniref:LacI family DNA-binding transcriptional regulator n=1 Tax=Enterococcus TaxID=1350 RepID=UPI0010F5A8E7|nr:MULTISPECIES: LacI family DNA-binding transcriptional regulator [Enterococcus]KAF1302628.1 hypothetical protein BAU16_06185 [Enterococcus sp. JM9B]